MTRTEKAIRDFCGNRADWWPSANQVQAMLALAQPEQELYSELLFAVGKKYPNETRHQTALRYIQQAEICAVEQGKADHGIGDKT